LPMAWRERAFVRRGPLFCLAEEFGGCVEFLLEDIRAAMPGGPFDLVLCRNLPFTYFDEAAQRRILDRLEQRIVPGGFLVLGSHEVLPAGCGGFARFAADLPIYRRQSPILERC
jgi:chemotaxis protein methyltransferase CheR